VLLIASAAPRPSRRTGRPRPDASRLASAVRAGEARTRRTFMRAATCAGRGLGTSTPTSSSDRAIVLLYMFSRRPRPRPTELQESVPTSGTCQATSRAGARRVPVPIEEWGHAHRRRGPPPRIPEDDWAAPRIDTQLVFDDPPDGIEKDSALAGHDAGPGAQSLCAGWGRSAGIAQEKKSNRARLDATASRRGRPALFARMSSDPRLSSDTSDPSRTRRSAQHGQDLHSHGPMSLDGFIRDAPTDTAGRAVRELLPGRRRAGGEPAQTTKSFVLPRPPPAVPAVLGTEVTEQRGRRW